MRKKKEIKNSELINYGDILTDKETITKTVIKEKVDEDGNVLETTTEEQEIPVDYNLSTSAISKETLIDLLS